MQNYNQKNPLNHPALDNLKENHKHPSSLELMKSKLKYWIMPARPPDNCWSWQEDGSKRLWHETGRLDVGVG